jgi:hypothetical protein
MTTKELDPGSAVWRLHHVNEGDRFLKAADMMVTEPSKYTDVLGDLRAAEVLTQLAAVHYQAAALKL